MSWFPWFTKQLRDIARHHLQRERPGHTLQSAALVHEPYLRLVYQRRFDTENRAHFLVVASRLMRQILGRLRPQPRRSQSRRGPHRQTGHFDCAAAGARRGRGCIGRRPETFLPDWTDSQAASSR
jgi:hypothetical protein